MKRFEITLKGVTPLMHHRMTEESMMNLAGVNGRGKGKKKTTEEKPELSLRDIAEQHSYKVGEHYVIPTGYVVGAFKSVASEYKQKDSQRKSMKGIAGGIFRPEEEFLQLTDNDGDPITTFEVDIRKATNHLKGAVAVIRPRFDTWNIKGVFAIDTDLVTPSMCLDMLNDAGKRAGIGSFRVSKGGYYGQFQVIKFEEVKE